MSLWFWPLVTAGSLLLLTLPLLAHRPDPGGLLARWLWPGDASSATALLQTVATASMTAMPAVSAGRPLPVFALDLSLLLGLAGAAMLVGFVAHLVRRLRVDDMMISVHGDTRASLDEAYPPYGAGPARPGEQEVPGPEVGIVVPARRSGFVRVVRPSCLVAAARRYEVLVWVTVRPGDSVVVGSPVAAVLPVRGGPVQVDELGDDVARAVVLGPERTEEQDVAFGLRQLVDIAVKAISPAVNDPTTAAEALCYCADLLVQLQSRRLGPQVHRDEDGRPTVVTVDRDLGYFLHLVCSQVRRFGRREPAVLIAVLRLLRGMAASARDDDQRTQIAAQRALVLAEMSDGLVEEDLTEVRDMARRVDLALAGELEGAYHDPSGLTRSI